MKNIKPFYDKRFNQWCINYTTKDGGYGAVWEDTEEKVIERYKILCSKEEDADCPK